MTKPLSGNPYNIPVINNLRGVAATMVAFFHFVCLTKGYFTKGTDVFSFFYFLKHGVQVFFVISGIVIPLSMIKGDYTVGKWGTFMLKRFVRLEPAYIVAIGVAVVYFQVRRFVPSSSSEDMMLSTKELLLHLGYLIPFFEGSVWAVDSMWTLSIEFSYYLLMSVLLPLCVKSWFQRYIFYALFLLLPLSGTSTDFFPAHSTIFLIGVVYALWFTGKINTSEYFIISLISFLESAFVLPWTHSVVALVTILIIHYCKDYHNRYLGFLGAISYSLYLLHQATGAPVINYMSHFMKEGYQKAIVVITGYVVSIGCAYVLYRLVELPTLKLSKRLRYHSTGK